LAETLYQSLLTHGSVGVIGSRAMSNFLSVQSVQSIRTLHLGGWSQRRIAKELGINRETVARYLRQDDSVVKPATLPSDLTRPYEGSSMISDAQVRKLRRLLGAGHPLNRAALKVGMDEKSARKYRDADRLPSEKSSARTWRTRQDPFHDVWPELLELLRVNPELRAKTLFCDLQDRFPGRFSDSQLRTLQRKIMAWRVTLRPSDETFGEQCRRPRRLESLGHADHRWMLRVLQGKQRIDSIRTSANDTESLDKLVTNLRHGTPRQRNKSLTVLATLHGVSLRSISRFLHIDRQTASAYWDTFRLFGCERLFKRSRDKALKSQNTVLIEGVFAILHSPPSAFQINRTTRKMEDLRRVLTEKGHKVSTRTIRTIVREAGYQWRKARKVLTSNDPGYQEKLAKIQAVLSALGPNERFFSIDEYGPFAVKMQGGRSLMPPGVVRVVPQRQQSKGRLIVTAALELSTNQVTHFYSEKKNTCEMIRLLEVLLVQYSACDKIYFSWDAASWHASKALNRRVDEINSGESRTVHRSPIVELVPLPTSAQFLNVIESVFSGMARAVIHNSDYESLEACKAAIDRHFAERNAFFKANPKKAGRIIWGKEITPSAFSPANNCKHRHHFFFGL
jgi:transposase